MKLEHATLLAVALALGGCASSAPTSRAPLVPMTDAVGTTTITSALEPTSADEDTQQETVRASKAQRSLDAESQRALDAHEKKTASREGKRQHAFADWK